jgi:hypothetical protein
MSNHLNFKKILFRKNKHLSVLGFSSHIDWFFIIIFGCICLLISFSLGQRQFEKLNETINMAEATPPDVTLDTSSELKKMKDTILRLSSKKDFSLLRLENAEILNSTTTSNASSSQE